jgi:hypothetical protein
MYRKLSVDIKIENKYFSQDILIADIQNDGILGVDFLSCHKCDVLLSKSCLLIKGNKIPCYHLALVFDTGRFPCTLRAEFELSFLFL